MSRAQRLLDLIQILRSRRLAVTGTQLASELGISLRTLYRDIASLQQQGAPIESEPGLGYVLRPGFMLPPLMFSEEEIEALVLGSRWVAQRTDDKLGAAAKNALVKIASVLPDELRHILDASTLMVGPCKNLSGHDEMSRQIRQAIRAERKLEIHYVDLKDVLTVRTIWPFAMGYFDQVLVLIGWCEMRSSYRHFRTDRIVSLCVSGQRYPQRRQVLLKAWREIENIPPQ
ncbi:helix-turn-helix transcriptional regulator [Undibacterium rugosum]|uniref:YafY family transcriptional regulator n=2 Tax=Undibacterium TaxID=401469 RepID=A0A923I3I4_9BURK|nr:YafY family protein [Undibacterium rugosum]MBC3935832.1 YafY family transcriptional regulator [Undibacterium rugosum]MBR7779386.1 YafY family transcriptional regulator [Undibacterium rugosum]